MFKRKQKYTDLELLEGLRRGDNRTLSYLYSNYIKVAHSIAEIYSNYGIDVDELVQTTMVVFYEKVTAPSFALTAKLSTVFYGFCLNKCREMAKSSRKYMSMEIGDEDEFPVWEPVKSAIDEWLEKFGKEGMHNCLKSLNDRQKNIIIGYYYGQLSMAEIAEKEKMTGANHAKVVKARAIEELKKCMGL